MERTRCFHGYTRCGFCRIPAKAAPKARRRCACCGRFMPTLRAANACAVCVRRGFEPLRLPLAG